ncbi:MAG: elongation factor 4 [Nitrospirae bacterium]|nr:elongation factor 4 [Nitrospirota bacterium]
MTQPIRNFAIIAHIDHGKSTLADRLLELTGAVPAREARDQLLDSMDLERERGITIKAHAVRLTYTARDGKPYRMHLIDTPGHVDFSYEVSRSLAACEGALLLIDASQGVEAQTIANAQLAQANGLKLIPVINKIDLPSADPDRCRRQLEELLDIDGDEAILASAKEGLGVPEILEAIVERIPPPADHTDEPLRALIMDSWFDSYQGVIVLVRIVDGQVRTGDRIRFWASGAESAVLELGVFTPKRHSQESLSSGEVGYMVAGVKNLQDAKVGDTVTNADRPAAAARLPGFQDVKPMVYCGFYPSESGQFDELREAVEKLQLNDASFTFEPETSLALGFGFRCGFLGLLHMDIIKERLEREYHIPLICTTPTVNYRIHLTNGEQQWVHNPANFPESQHIEMIEEPVILATISLPEESIGPVLGLCQDRRGVQRDVRYLDRRRAIVRYELPLNEVILDFHDRLKSISHGYASLDYELIGYQAEELVRVDVLLNGERVDALSFITHKGKAYQRGRELVEQMRTLIPKQMFEVAIQAAIGHKVIARETIAAMKKNVTAKCYGGDITRKRKLWEKQKQGKKRMKQVGRIEVPQEAFLALLKAKV